MTMPTDREHLEQQARTLQDALNQWVRDLSDPGRNAGRLVKEVHVVAETTSTQDVCSDLAAGRTGVCCISLNQSKGRGRFGRVWMSEPGANLSLTISAPFDQDPERVSIVAGLAACATVETMMSTNRSARASGKEHIGIRWPNDVIINHAKIAGVLTEIHAGVAFIGVGLNVNQIDWPIDPGQPVTSLRIESGREYALQSIASTFLESLATAWEWSDRTLAARFSERDLLHGRICVFDSQGIGRIQGRVRNVDPLHGIEIEVRDQSNPSMDGSILFLSSARTSVVRIE